MTLNPYPTDAELREISTWGGAWPDLLEWVRSLWWPDGIRGWSHVGRTYELATGGWRGNEDIIGALRDNLMFWAICWQSSHRGGLHIFETPMFDRSKP